MIPKKLFIENLKKVREELGLTQHQISDKLGIERWRWACWEYGKSEPNINMLANISEVTGVSLDRLLTTQL